jgi:hypothetical protein
VNAKNAWGIALGVVAIVLGFAIVRIFHVHELWQDVVMVTLDVGGITIGFADAFDAASPFNRKDAYWLWACLAMSALDFSAGLPLTGVAWLPYSGFLAVKKIRTMRQAGGASVAA